MAEYQIALHDCHGSPQRVIVIEVDHDDAAIDYAGTIQHPNEMTVRRGERVIGRFPVWPPLRRRD